MSKELEEIIAFFEANRDEENIAGMARFGIVNSNSYGIAAPVIRELGKKYKNNHSLAIELWQQGKRESRVLAGLVAVRSSATPELMDEWTSDFDSWDICDGTCYNYFRYLPWAYEKPYQYAKSEDEFTRRTAFALIAGLAVGDKKATDDQFTPYFELITQHSHDDRNYVCKAINWALRQMGKRNKSLHTKAKEVANQLANSENKTARWIGKDALREFNNPKIIARIK